METMYDPKDYNHKKVQVRKQRKAIVIMAAMLVLTIIVSIAQQKQLKAAEDFQWQCREKMWSAYDRCDSLNHRIAQLEGEKWYSNNLRNE